MQFEIGLPTPTAPDVASGELTIQIGSNEPFVINTTPTEQTIQDARFSGADGETVIATFVFVDDAGNKSQAREASAVLADTIPPPQPGELAIRVTGE